MQENQLQKALLRSSLSHLETQLPGPVVRCHRSYLVNLHQVGQVTGNAQGYRLHLHGGQAVVPVARRYAETVLGQL